MIWFQSVNMARRQLLFFSIGVSSIRNISKYLDFTIQQILIISTEFKFSEELLKVGCNFSMLTWRLNDPNWQKRNTDKI